jgi:hypothetical protein
MKYLSQILTMVILLGASGKLLAQDGMVPLNRDYYHMMDRLDITDSGQVSFHTAHKPYRRQKLGNYVQKKIIGHKLTYPTDSTGVFLYYDRFLGASYDLQYLGKDNWEYCKTSRSGRPWWKPQEGRKFPRGFYHTTASAYSVNEENFTLSANPVLGFVKTWDNGSGDNIYQNTRGFQIRGGIGKKVGFYTFVSENQFRYPEYYRNQIDTQGVIPGVGFYKRFKQTGHDFFNARGYITFSPIEEIAVQFGHDQNFIGDGYRSLIWSDNAKENLFLKLQTEVWKIRYVNIFSELTDVDKVQGNGEGISKKYSAFHHLNIALKPNLHIGFFEHIIFDRSDSSTSPTYELNYLNPVIFYRAAEHGLNSSDNVIMGLNWKWNFKRSFSFYGQYVLDEFKKDELFKRTGWWANKWAFQSGLKYINAFKTEFLDLQYEFNVVRPYTYTHFKKSQNYTNYNQSLAHPLGANFTEHAFIMRAHLGYPIYVVAKLLYSQQGLDSSSNSFYTHGGDLGKDYLSRPAERGISIGDGVSNDLLTFEFRLSYLFIHNLFVDLTYIQRKQDNALYGEQKNSFVGLGLRYHLPYKSLN